MLRCFRNGLGLRIAMTLAVLAALCLVAPPAVMAFGHGEQTAHCLSHGDQMDHGGYMASGGMDHSQHGNAPVKHESGCCGLFCVSAIAPQAQAIVVLSFAPVSHLIGATAAFNGRIPDQPNRPPISPLSA